MKRRLADLFYQERPMLLLWALAFCVATAFVYTHQRPEREYRAGPFIKASAREFRTLAPDYFIHWRKNFLSANSASDRTGLVRGIFLGSDENVRTENRELFRQAGLSHLLAASGFNCWITASAFHFVFAIALAALIGFLPSLVFLQLKDWGEPVSRFLGAWCFWLWSDQSPPISRSTLCISLLFALQCFGLRASSIRVTLTLYAFSMLFWPRLSLNPSLHLTFGCLFGLIVMPKLAKKAGLGFKPIFFSQYLFSSLGACLGTLPSTWIFFGEINFMSLLTNWFAVPLTSLLLMPLCLLQIFLVAPGVPKIFHPVVATLGQLEHHCVALLVITLESALKVLPSLHYSD